MRRAGQGVTREGASVCRVQRGRRGTHLTAVYPALFLKRSLVFRHMSDLAMVWYNERICYFTLFDFVSPLPLNWMFIIHCVMALGKRMEETRFHVAFRPELVVYVRPFRVSPERF